MRGSRIAITAFAGVVLAAASDCGSSEDGTDAGLMTDVPWVSGERTVDVMGEGADDARAGAMGAGTDNAGTDAAVTDRASAAGAGGPRTGTVAAGRGSAAAIETSCDITSNLTMSTAISTVGIVEFNTDLAGVDGGYIEFGLDDAFDMQAPVDPAEPNYRTLLLGMKPEQEYHYRIVVTAGDQRCTGPDETLQTGSIPNTLRPVTVTTPQPDKVAKGFMIMGSITNGPVFILDSDGDYVWWANAGGLMRAHMSYDGKYIWTQALNWGTGIGPVPQSGFPGGHAAFHRISMDGMQMDTYGEDEFGDATHDFDVTSDGSYLFADINGWDNCAMKVVERTADGQRRDVFNVSDYYQASDCLINAMHYWPDDDSITVSELPSNAIIKLTRSGEIAWVLNGDHSTFTQGDAPRWVGGQHGHQLVTPDRILVFVNGINPYTNERDPGDSSMVYEIQLDPATGTANKVWEYDGGLRAIVFGDVQRLPNGNTLVDYGSANEIHEVDGDGQLVQSIRFAAGGSPPYVEWRSSLYGGAPW